tara:strand:+ start:295 stop:1317 length:1023 start_codon:yes stop_codon:yes gene_type:complete
MKILVTGAAGFIGFHLCYKLLEKNNSVVGIDNFNDYYDPSLKHARKNELDKFAFKKGLNFDLLDGDISNSSDLNRIFSHYKPEVVVNLAAQAGVRYSIENPSAYIKANILGFSNILEECRNKSIKHLIYASSSSVYGGNINMPFKENQSVDHPISLYAATKKSNEVMAHSYSHLYDLPTTGLRFFTVYGPWGRPDMALFLFTKSIIEEKPINIFNNGKMVRDFTYIDDVVEGVCRLIPKPPIGNELFDKHNPDPSSSWSPYQIFNIGNSCPTPLMEYIKAIENAVGKKAKNNFLGMQPGDVEKTSSCTKKLEDWIGFKPNTSIVEGVNKFVKWYRQYYKI